MFKNIYPLFERKRLLKKEMLENLRDYPRTIFQILYQDYSDGVLSGCGLRVADDGLVIEPGIIYYRKTPYILEQERKIAYNPTGEFAYLKLRCLERVAGVEQDEYLSQICLDQTAPDKEHEIELARFKLQKGARLRNEYTGFFDFDTEFDTINRIHVPYAAPGRSSISPEILKAYARELMQYSAENAQDYSFCMSCIERRDTLPYEAIEAYLNIRTQSSKTNYTNGEIYRLLKGILAESSGRGSRKSASNRNDKKLLLI